MRASGVVVGFALLLAFWALGEVLVRLIHAPIPGNVVGMVLLSIALLAGWVRLEAVAAVADALLQHLGLLFVPPGVGVMLHFGLIRKEWLPITASLVISTFAVLAATGWVAHLLTRADEGAAGE